MEIFVAKHSGFCFGVRRSLSMAEKAAKSGQVYTDGPLIHNPQEINRLAQQLAIIPLDDFSKHSPTKHGANAKIIIRSHGVAPQREQLAKASGFEVLDATCPFVKKSQLLAQELAADGYTVVIVGDPGHPEVEGLIGWAGSKALVAANPQSVAELAINHDLSKIGIIAQTTQLAANFELTVAALKQYALQIKVANTICNATSEHQEEALALAKQVDMMLVIGGKNSSNTKKLAQICKTVLAKVYHIETAADLHCNIVWGVAKIGITAGASTPDWIIEEVVETMTEMEKMQAMEGESSTLEQEACGCGCTTEQAACACDGECAPEPKAEPAETMSEEDSFAAEYGDMKEIRRGTRVKGVIVQVKPDELLVDIGGKSEGVLTASELSADDAKEILTRFKVGDEIDVFILRKENQEGYPVLSKRRIDQELAWDKLIIAKDNNEVISGKVVGVVKGGLLVDVGIRGFVPASLASLNYVEDLNTYIGQEMQMKIIECEKAANKLVLSAKAVLRKASQEKREQTWATIAEGQTLRGTVRRLTGFGAFVDVGGVDGLLHVSEMAWYRVNHPSDLLKEGDELDVYVLAIDQASEKISLGLKQLVSNPWSAAKENYPEGSIITATVMRTTTFGAFLEVEPGIEGLVHISQLAHQRVEKTEDVVKPGDSVEVKVLSVDTEGKRMSLSIKAATAKEEAAEMPEAAEGEPVYSSDAAEEVVASAEETE